MFLFTCVFHYLYFQLPSFSITMNFPLPAFSVTCVFHYLRFPLPAFSTISSHFHYLRFSITCIFHYLRFPLPAFSITGVFHYLRFPLPAFSITCVFHLYRRFPLPAFSITCVFHYLRFHLYRRFPLPAFSGDPFFYNLPTSSLSIVEGVLNNLLISHLHVDIIKFMAVARFTNNSGDSRLEGFVLLNDTLSPFHTMTIECCDLLLHLPFCDVTIH